MWALVATLALGVGALRHGSDPVLLETNISTEPEAAALVDAAGELLSERGPAVAVAADSVGLNEAEQHAAYAAEARAISEMNRGARRPVLDESGAEIIPVQGETVDEAMRRQNYEYEIREISGENERLHERPSLVRVANQEPAKPSPPPKAPAQGKPAGGQQATAVEPKTKLKAAKRTLDGQSAALVSSKDSSSSSSSTTSFFDAIAFYRSDSNSELFAPGTALGVTLLCAAGLCIVYMAYDVAQADGPVARAKRMDGAANAGVLIAAFTLCTCIIVASMSVLRAQGLEHSRTEEDKAVRGTTAFRLDEHFIPSVVCGSLALLALVFAAWYKSRPRDYLLVSGKSGSDVLVAANLLSRGRPAAQSEADAVIGTAVAEAREEGKKGGIPTADAVPVTTGGTAPPGGADPAPRGSGWSVQEERENADQEADARISHGSGHLKYLVVVGLVLWSFVDVPAMERVGLWRAYLLLETIFVPVFVLLAGYTCARSPDRGATASRLARVVQVVVCFLVCQFYFFVFVNYVFGPLCEANMDRDSAWFWVQRVNPWNNFPRNPLARYLGKAFGHLWYLQALSLWALVVPLTVRRARYPITISVALSVVAMYLCTPLNYMPWSFAPMLEYLPYFVAGFELKRRNLDRALDRAGSNTQVRAGVAACLLALVALACMSPFSTLHEVGIFAIPGVGIPRKTYDRQVWYGIPRVAYHALAVLCAYAAYVLLPKRETYFSRAAAGSLVPYILAPFVPLFLIGLGYYGGKETDSPGVWAIGRQMQGWQQFLTALLGLAVANALYHPFVFRRLRWAILPPIGWALRLVGLSKAGAKAGKPAQETEAKGTKALFGKPAASGPVPVM